MKLLLAAFVISLASCRAQSRDTPTANTDSTASILLEIYTYGLPDFDGERARLRVAKRWGFTYRAIAGCVVTQELLDSADQHNQLVETAIAKRHGPDWKVRFEDEASAARHMDTLTRGIVFDNPVMRAASASLDSQGKGLLIEPTGIGRDGRTVDALAYTYDEWQGRRAYVALYELRVDTVARTTTITGTERRLFQYLD